MTEKKWAGQTRSPGSSIGSNSAKNENGDSTNLLAKQMKHQVLKDYYKNKRRMRDEVDYQSLG